MLERIVGQKWAGLFLAFDYGKYWQELAGNIPGGTGRTYHRQKMGNDLLAPPGRQDLTCHICWHLLHDRLTHARFRVAPVDSPDTIFISYTPRPPPDTTH